MRNLVMSSVLAVGMLMMSTGCKTVDLGVLNDTGEKLARIENLCKVVSFVSVSLRLESKPANRREVLLTKAALELLFIKGEPFDLESLREALSQMPDGHIINERAGILITAAGMILSDNGGVSIALTTPAEVKAVAVGLRDGINMALLTVPAKPATP